MKGSALGPYRTLRPAFEQPEAQDTERSAEPAIQEVFTIDNDDWLPNVPHQLPWLNRWLYNNDKTNQLNQIPEAVSTTAPGEVSRTMDGRDIFRAFSHGVISLARSRDTTLPEHDRQLTKFRHIGYPTLFLAYNIEKRGVGAGRWPKRVKRKISDARQYWDYPIYAYPIRNGIPNEMPVDRSTQDYPGPDRVLFQYTHDDDQGTPLFIGVVSHQYFGKNPQYYWAKVNSLSYVAVQDDPQGIRQQTNVLAEPVANNTQHYDNYQPLAGPSGYSEASTSARQYQTGSQEPSLGQFQYQPPMQAQWQIQRGDQYNVQYQPQLHLRYQTAGENHDAYHIQYPTTSQYQSFGQDTSTQGGRLVYPSELIAQSQGQAQGQAQPSEQRQYKYPSELLDQYGIYR